MFNLYTLPMRQVFAVSLQGGNQGREVSAFIPVGAQLMMAVEETTLWPVFSAGSSIWRKTGLWATRAPGDVLWLSWSFLEVSLELIHVSSVTTVG